MPSLSTLPNELLRGIVASLDDKSAVGNLRLTNRHLNAIATEEYFARVPLYAHWGPMETYDPPWPNNIDYDAAMFRNILDSDKLSKLVKRVDIYTCNPDCVSTVIRLVCNCTTLNCEES